MFDPARAAELGIQIPRMAQVAGSAADVSGGFVDIGRRQYPMRFAGRYSVDQFADLVIECELKPYDIIDVSDGSPWSIKNLPLTLLGFAQQGASNVVTGTSYRVIQ